MCPGNRSVCPESNSLRPGSNSVCPGNTKIIEILLEKLPQQRTLIAKEMNSMMVLCGSHQSNAFLFSVHSNGVYFFSSVYRSLLFSSV